MSKVFDVAVVGATGAVGETMLRVLHERNFPVGKVYPLASSRSAGKRVDFGGKMLLVEDLDSFDFSKQGKTEMPPKPGIHPGGADNFIHAMPAYIPDLA
ncbi:MAG: hypothetical protein ABF326_12860, partial [Arenicellales bacterium]